MSSFCNAFAMQKLLTFLQQNIDVFENTLATTINEFVNNDSEQLGPDVLLNPGPAEP